jgi:integrase
MAPTMNIKPLLIPESKKWKGLTVYCYKCKTNVSDICKSSGKPLSQCKHGDKHVFKVYVHVPGTENQRKTKKLETRDLNEAIKQAIEFEKEVKSGSFQILKSERKEIIERQESQNQVRPYLLVQALARYIGWLHNEGVPPHMRRERSEEHIKDVERALKYLVSCLKENGYNPTSLKVDDIDNEMVGKVFSGLENKKVANRTFNKYFGFYTSFLKWYAEEYDHPMRNHFEKVERRNLNPKPEAITQKEYEALLPIVTLENGIKEYENGVKPTRNLFRPWLTDGIRLGLETGRRREEIINLKWKDIEESEGFQFIKVEDYKVNRIQHRTRDEEKKFIYIPVTDSLRNLLDELGYNKYINMDCFILAPEIKISRGRVMSDTLSRGFTHYYDQLNTGRKLTFKCLRKTYITNLQIFMNGGNTKAITGHSDEQVIERNYLDKKEMAKAAQGFNVYSKEERGQELKQTRATTKAKTEQKELEV